MNDEELNPCEYCPNSHVLCENGFYKAECALPEGVDPEDFLDSRCINNDD